MHALTLAVLAVAAVATAVRAAAADDDAAHTFLAASPCDSSTELSVVVNYDYPAYAAMGTALECVHAATGAVRPVFNFSTASAGQLVATGTPFTPNFGSSIQYLAGALMIPMAQVDAPGGVYSAVPATYTASPAAALVWANASYGYSLQPDEMLLYASARHADGSVASFEVVGGVTFAPSESDPFAKHLFRYASTSTDAPPKWFANVSTPVGGFFVGVCATIDQARGVYHFVATDTSSAALWSVDLKTNKATSAPTNDYGPEMTSLTWNSADGKLYAVAQTDVTTVTVVTVDPATGAATVVATLDLSAHDGLTFQAPAAFNFDRGVVSLVVQYGTTPCPTNAVYTYALATGKLVAGVDVKVPADVPACVWTPVTQDYNHKI